jgi:glycosyltransferase involved in cell wall biosynthesis
MSTIKVLHVIARMNVGGTARYVGDLLQNIPNSALATGYVQGSEIEDPVVIKINPHRIPHMGRAISPFNDFKAWLELRKLINEIKPEIVHTHTFKAGLLGRLVGGNHKRVHTFHGHLFDDQSFSPIEKMVITFSERYLAKRTDVLISVGERVGQDLRASGIGPNKKWVSIAPGVEALPSFDKAEARKILGVKADVFLVGWMARMTGVKNPLLALDVAKKMPDVQFVMAGGGDLLELVAKSAPANVAVIGWADASLFWSAVDCALSTSDNEGMPIALIEAQLAGIPVVATDVGSNSEIIQDSVTGILAKRDATSLAKALGNIVSEKRLFKTLADQARMESSKKFGLADMLNKHLSSYSELQA